MTVGGSTRSIALAIMAIMAIAAGPAAAAPATETPPASLISGAPAQGAAINPVFKLLELQRLGCKFSEEKRVALLARPLKSTGTIYFERDKGIARTTLTPKVQHVVLTKTTLRIKTDKKSEEIPLDKSKDLKAFALIFPTLLRGDRAELEKSFAIGLYGSDKDWWALAFTPKTDSLKKLIKRVVVFGKKTDIVSLQIVEASGDTTDTRLTDLLKNADVPDAEIAKAFGAPGAK
ncbi:MAG: outer membrane lipoprotein carrier protein LolA [Deltaproteobacteria bacterium]|nr:outer membrane lipoprotein carrier protein LolA [Deltaproteobacteria bacterium]